MAYTPDKAFEDVNEVGQKAFLLYSFYCKHGSMSNNVVSVSLEAGARFIGVVYENACRLNAKLKKKGWIEHKNGKTVLVKGYEELTKTTVSKPKTDDSISFQKLKTDENNSFQQETDKNVSSQISKTDENVSQKLTKTTVAYKGRTSPLEPVRKEKDISIEISKKNLPARLPDDFTVSPEMKLWAVKSVPTVSIEYETEQFIDHYKTAGGKNAVGLDWTAKWRKWMRNSFTEFGKYPKGKPKEQNGVKTNGSSQTNNRQYRVERTDDDVFRESAEFYRNPANFT